LPKMWQNLHPRFKNQKIPQSSSRGSLMMKKLLLIIFIFILISLLSIIWFVNSIMPLGNDKSIKHFEIAPGTNAYQIGINLQNQNLIKSAIAFRIYSQITQSAKFIKPGTYELSNNLGVPQITNKLLAGPVSIWVTLPEGLRREEMADRFIESLSLRGQEAKDFKDKFLSLTQGKEGYLFPDTYLVSKDSTPANLVKMLEDNFEKKVNSNIDKSTLILASIIERETKSEEERPIVAG